MAIAPGPTAVSLDRSDAVADRAAGQRDEAVAGRHAARCRAMIEPKFGG